MAYFKTNVLDNQIKALPTVSTASGSVATFTTDKTENLVEVECEIVYSQASGTPSPSNPLPITTYTSLNLSHSGADTSNPTVYNILFGQTVAKGTLNVSTGVLEITQRVIIFNGTQPDSDFIFASGTPNRITWRNFQNIGKIGSTNFISDKLNNLGSYTSYPPEWNISNSSATVARCFIGVPSTITSVSDWQTYVSNENITLVYELNTPQIVQLSATQIQALLNENNIWCDTNGNTSVKYILSVGKAVNV